MDERTPRLSHAEGWQSGSVELLLQAGTVSIGLTEFSDQLIHLSRVLRACGDCSHAVELGGGRSGSLGVCLDEVATYKSLQDR